MTEKTHELPDIFGAAIVIRDEKERGELIERMTLDQPELRSQVKELLKAHHAASSFLSRPPQELAATDFQRGKPSTKNESVMTSLRSDFSLSPIALRDETDDTPDPVLRPNSSEIPNRDSNDKYQLQGEIARGGMGAILQGRDIDLGRSLAIKVLLEDHKDNPQIIQRFIEEAQIGGQLQHPGITPVYEIGQFADQRPFFSMKLVKGKTLAALLSERKNVFDRGKLLGIFEQVCQTMAYAHSRGVIHRDLKPANIMVGAFGEVQVMDWGLAKVLESGGVADEKKARQQHTAHSVIQTYRSDGSGPAMVGTDPANAGDTLAGSVMGTPAYMPPEQARGEVERLDERCDTFGLGAILCEILTGRPPYYDDNSREIIHLAQKGDMETAYTDLNACRADTELVEIAKEALAPEPSKRIRDAKVLAERVSGYLEGVEAKLHETELARAAEKTRAIEARKRHRVTLALAASILLTLGLGTAAWLWNQSQSNQRRIAATDKVNAAIGEARLQFGLAKSADASNKIDELEKAIASANTANELAENDAVDSTLKLTTNEFLVSLQQELETAQRQAKLAQAEQELKEKLEFIQLSHADGKKAIDTRPGRSASKNFNTFGTRKKYATAFREAGHDVKKLPKSEIVDWISNSEIRDTLISALDHWAQCLPNSLLGNHASWMQATSWEQAAEINKQLRDNDRDSSLRWMIYGATFANIGDDEEFRRFCQELLEHFEKSNSIYIQERVCKMCLFKPGMVDVEDLPKRWMTVLEKQRLPQNQQFWFAWAWNVRALISLRQGDYETVLSDIEKSEAQSPEEINQTLNHCVRALALHHLGKADLAESSLEKAVLSLKNVMQISTRFHNDHIGSRILIAEAEQLIRPDQASSKFPLDQFPRKKSEAGNVSVQEVLAADSINQKLFDIANAVDANETRRTVRMALLEGETDSLKKIADGATIKDLLPEVVFSLASSLSVAAHVEIAESVLRVSQREHPGDFWVNFELGKCLIELKKLEEGIGFSRAALSIRPTSVGAMWVVTSALMDAKRDKEAMEQFKVMLAKSNLSASGYEGLATSMQNYGNWEAAELAIRKALSMKPNNTYFAGRLARILSNLGNETAALAFLEKAMKSNPDDGFSNYQYATLLWRAGREKEAIAQVRKLIKMYPEQGGFYNLLGVYLGQMGEEEEALVALKQAVKFSTNSESYRENLAIAFSKLGLRDEAGEQKILAIDVYKKRESSIRKVIADDPRSADAHYDLGYVLHQQRKIVQAAESYKRAIEIDGTISTWHYKYGFALFALEQKEKALEQWQEALALNPELAKYHERVGFALNALGRRNEAVPYYREAVKLNPDNEPARIRLTALLQASGNSNDAIELARKEVENSDKDPQAFMGLARLLFNDGQLEECEQTLLDGLQLSPKQPEFFIYFLGDVLAARGKTEQAIKTLENALKANDHGLLHCSLANIVYLSLGDTERAVSEYRKALDSDNVVCHRLARLGLTDILTKTGRIEDAEKLYSVDGMSIESFPLLHCQKIYTQFVKGEKRAALIEVKQFVNDHPQLRYGYACWADMLVYEANERGKYPNAMKAIELIQKALVIKPNHSSSFATLGNAQYRAGDSKSAISSLRKAETLGLRHPLVWLHLAMAYDDEGKDAEAQKRLNQSEEWIANSTGKFPYLDRLLDEAKMKLNN